MPNPQRLDRLRFEDAFNDCIALSELSMDMVEAVSSRAELVWIQNGFKPTREIHVAKSRRRPKTPTLSDRRRAE